MRDTRLVQIREMAREIRDITDELLDEGTGGQDVLLVQLIGQCAESIVSRSEHLYQGEK
jgi:hypothetical protein